MYLALSPYIRVAWYSVLEPHTVIGPRDIFDYELLYLKEGSAVITIEDKQYDATSGDVFLFRPHQRHTIDCSNDVPVIQPHIHFDLQYQPNSPDVYVSYRTEDRIPPEHRHLFRQDILRDLFPQLPSHVHLSDGSLFEAYLFDLIDEFNHPSVLSQVRQQWLFLRLLDLFISESSYSWHKVSSSGAENTASRIKLYLDNNTSSRITLDDLALVLHMDKSYLVNLFKRFYGETPISYHQKLRIEKARNMLMYTNLSITQIASATGFSSIHDFDRVFRKLNHDTPSAYRTRR